MSFGENVAKNIDYNNPNSYKKCRKKQYDIHVCMPQKGTIVVNKLEQAQMFDNLHRRGMISVADRDADAVLSANWQAWAQKGLLYVVSEKQPFVLAGTQGEMWAIGADKLANKYMFIIDNQPVRITPETLQKKVKDGVLDWTVVRTVPDNSEAFACFVPKNIKGQIHTSWGAVLNFNDNLVKHGKGDFIIAANAGGKPNLNDRYVVNGEVFARTYDNRGWSDCLDQNVVNAAPVSIDQLPKVEGIIGDTEAKDQSDYIVKRYFASKKYKENAFDDDGYTKPESDIVVYAKLSSNLEWVSKTSYDDVSKLLKENKDFYLKKYVLSTLLFMSRYANYVMDDDNECRLLGKYLLGNEFNYVRGTNSTVLTRGMFDTLGSIYLKSKPISEMFQTTITHKGSKPSNSDCYLAKYRYHNFCIHGKTYAVLFVTRCDIGVVGTVVDESDYTFAQVIVIPEDIKEREQRNGFITNYGYLENEAARRVYKRLKTSTEARNDFSFEMWKFVAERINRANNYLGVLHSGSITPNEVLELFMDYAEADNINVIPSTWSGDSVRCPNYYNSCMILFDVMSQYFAKSSSRVFFDTSSVKEIRHETRDEMQRLLLSFRPTSDLSDNYWFSIYSDNIESFDREVDIIFNRGNEKPTVCAIPKEYLKNFTKGCNDDVTADGFKLIHLKNLRDTELYKFISRNFKDYMKSISLTLKDKYEAEKKEMFFKTFRGTINNLKLIFNADGFNVALGGQNKTPADGVEYTSAELQELLSSGSYRFTVSENNVSADGSVRKVALNSVTLFFKLVDDKLHYRGKENGNEVRESISISSFIKKLDFDEVSFDTIDFDALSSYMALKIYINICKELRITPFRYVTRRVYINSAISAYDNILMNMISSGDKTSVGYYLRLAKDSFVENYDPNSHSSAKFMLEYYNPVTKAPISRHNVEMRSRLDMKVFNELIKSLEAGVDARHGNGSDAFQVAIKVAYAPIITLSGADILGAGGKNALINAFNTGFDAEKERQRNSNAQQAANKQA